MERNQAPRPSFGCCPPPCELFTQVSNVKPFHNRPGRPILPGVDDNRDKEAVGEGTEQGSAREIDGLARRPSTFAKGGKSC